MRVDTGLQSPGSGSPPPSPTAQEKVEERRSRILTEFEKTRVLLEEEEQHLLQDLRQEEELTAARLREHADALAQQRHTLETLLLHLEEQGQRGPLHMLQVWLLLSWPGRAGESSGPGVVDQLGTNAA